MFKNDLVNRLETPWTFMGDIANQERKEAAIEIKNLQEKLNDCRETVAIFKSIVKFLCNNKEWDITDDCI